MRFHRWTKRLFNIILQHAQPRFAPITRRSRVRIGRGRRSRLTAVAAGVTNPAGRMEAQELFQIGKAGADNDEVGFDDAVDRVNKTHPVLVFCSFYAHENDG